MHETEITFITKQNNGTDQQSLIEYLKHQGITTVYVDRVIHQTKFKSPKSIAPKIKPSLKFFIIEYDGIPIKLSKTALMKQSKTEYKWCKMFQGICSRCGLRNEYCSRRGNLELPKPLNTVKVH